GQAVVDETQEGGRVALVDAAGVEVERAQGALGADVRGHPLVGERGEVGPGRVAVEAVAADAGPGGEVVLLAVAGGRRRDVVQVRERAAQPGAGVVLVADRVHAQAAHDGLHLAGRARGPQRGQ